MSIIYCIGYYTTSASVQRKNSTCKSVQRRHLKCLKVLSSNKFQ